MVPTSGLVHHADPLTLPGGAPPSPLCVPPLRLGHGTRTSVDCPPPPTPLQLYHSLSSLPCSWAIPPPPPGLSEPVPPRSVCLESRNDVVVGSATDPDNRVGPQATPAGVVIHPFHPPPPLPVL